MLVHYFDKYDSEMLVEIDQEVFKEMLRRVDGEDLAFEFSVEKKVVQRDPRQSELDQSDMFFSHNDVCTGQMTAQELLEEINELDEFNLL
jgi:hypothetical protein